MEQEFFSFVSSGFTALAGMGLLLIAGIYLFQIYSQLDEMNHYMEQVGISIGKLGLAVIALEQLAKENRTDFANATVSAIDALKLLRHEIEYQKQIEEIHRRKQEVSREVTAQQNSDPNWQYKPAWDQP